MYVDEKAGSIREHRVVGVTVERHQDGALTLDALKLRLRSRLQRAVDERDGDAGVETRLLVYVVN